jgi:DegV family protein with EDD domain
MPKIAIVTDSTAYLPAKIIKRYQLRVIPLKIHWGEETYLDGVDITPAEFYSRLAKDSVVPTTSQPSMQEFLQVFNNLISDGYEGIVAPLISSGISGTVASALAAAREFSHLPVEIVDTRSTSAGQGLVVLAAARAAAQGKSLMEVRRVAEEVAQRLHVFFTVDTLKYLHRGGRIGGAARYLGTALSIKPILYFNTEGKIDALERTRTKRKALQRLIILAEERSEGQTVHMGVIHANAPEVAEDFRKQIIQRLNCAEMFITELSPVIGTHVGPGTIGLALYTD